MNYLVDTHYLLWSLIEPARVGKVATDLLLDMHSIQYVSKISFWEIALKFSIGELKLEGTRPEEIPDAARESGFEILDNRIAFLSSDERLKAYTSHGLIIVV